MFDLTMDQAFAALLAIAVGTGAGLWLWWLGSKARAAAAELERRAELKRIQGDIRMRYFAGRREL